MDPRGTKILIIDEASAFHEIYREAVESLTLTSGTKVTCVSTHSLTDGLQKIASWKPDLVIVDIGDAGKDGVEICEVLRGRGITERYTAVVLISHEDDPNGLEKCLGVGGDEFCLKANAARELPFRLRSALRIKEMYEDLLKNNRELVKENRRLTLLSEVDELTGLLNMRSFKSRISAEFSRSQRHGLMMSIVMLDLDFFKNVNDSSNHLVGSYVLAEVGKIIKQNLRKHDLAARFGGDEYVVMLPHTGEMGAWKTAQNLERAIADSVFRVNEYEVKVTVSIGIEGFVPRISTFSDALEVMKVADQNLYRAKAHGRACIFSSLRNSEPLIDYTKEENLVRCLNIKSAS
jgi:diguanylate cyclase (GGDEF)-like protein